MIQIYYTKKTGILRINPFHFKSIQNFMIDLPMNIDFCREGIYDMHQCDKQQSSNRLLNLIDIEQAIKDNKKPCSLCFSRSSNFFLIQSCTSKKGTTFLKRIQHITQASHGGKIFYYKLIQKSPLSLFYQLFAIVFFSL